MQNWSHMNEKYHKNRNVEVSLGMPCLRLLACSHMHAGAGSTYSRQGFPQPNVLQAQMKVSVFTPWAETLGAILAQLCVGCHNLGLEQDNLFLADAAKGNRQL